MLVSSETLSVPSQLARLWDAFPRGADLGTLRLLAPGEDLPSAVLSPMLLPIAFGGDRDAFALYVPPEPSARISVVCAVSLDSGVYAPICATVRGFGAWLLLLRRAQGALPVAPRFAGKELLEESAPDAARLARVLELDALERAVVEPEPLALAAALRRVEPESPWACSLAARAASSPAEGLRMLGPPLAAAPFAAGLLEQAFELALRGQQVPRAQRALFGALSRLEPNLQAPPYRLDEPDAETGAVFEPLDAVDAYHFLREHGPALTSEMRGSAPLAFLQRMIEAGGGALDAATAIDLARRRGLGGDLPGGRWILHFALGELRGDAEARRAIGAELARSWKLAGRDVFAARCERLSG